MGKGKVKEKENFIKGIPQILILKEKENFIKGIPQILILKEKENFIKRIPRIPPSLRNSKKFFFITKLTTFIFLYHKHG